MDINNVISAFVGSFLGVTTGFLGAFYLEWRRNQRERRTHILAVIREMLSNNVRVQLLLKDKRREGVIEDQAWRELRVPLAGELPMDLYTRVASRYDEFLSVRKIYQELPTDEEWAEHDEGVHRLKVWADTMMEEHERLRALVDGQSDALLRALRRRQKRHAENSSTSTATTQGRAGDRD